MVCLRPFATYRFPLALILVRFGLPVRITSWRDIRGPSFRSHQDVNCSVTRPDLSSLRFTAATRQNRPYTRQFTNSTLTGDVHLELCLSLGDSPVVSDRMFPVGSRLLYPSPGCPTFGRRSSLEILPRPLAYPVISPGLCRILKGHRGSPRCAFL